MSTQPEVTIYTTPTCHFCHAAKDFFTDHNIAYREHDVAQDLEKRKEMIERSGQMGVPVITVGEQMVVGFDEQQLKELLKV
ncbi:NrdH-redoxin [Candidatus Kaiserbacteria bacterium CG10_big_fil_rev_8_21_14_0_10_59_10]|uniref:NrdH-redoxin n=1 Tax=Candidatus Kaiserbacteria bacterium CG10_big_fil_rev_8_21_14_0_10_59_10 TaxID=1974612 RepID=A0A2H0U7V7_9BACT|nr:MAG: NrdH-redoxin [Candidatus Kaiserbacteria bacterium CG10_big_fil_rev_8_21_14_0_10_59_10]